MASLKGQELVGMLAQVYGPAVYVCEACYEGRHFYCARGVCDCWKEH